MQSVSLCLLTVAEKPAREAITVAQVTFPKGGRTHRYEKTQRHNAKECNQAVLSQAADVLRVFGRHGPARIRITTNNPLAARLMIESLGPSKPKGLYADQCALFGAEAAAHRVVVVFATGDDMGEEGRAAYAAGFDRLIETLKEEAERLVPAAR